MLLSLGWFVFALRSVPFETLKRRTEWTWKSADRLGTRPAHQYLAPGQETLEISGCLMPELTGGAPALDRLRQMAHEGKAWMLTAGTGHILGRWFITSVTEDKSAFHRNGTARKSDFTISLEAYEGTDKTQLGSLVDQAPKSTTDLQKLVPTL